MNTSLQAIAHAKAINVNARVRVTVYGLLYFVVAKLNVNWLGSDSIPQDL